MSLRLKFGLGLAITALAVSGCTSAPPRAISTPAVNKADISPAGVATTTTSPVADRLMAEAQGFAFRVRNVDCLATGSSFLTTQGIVTNRHVASGAQTLQLSTWSGNDFNATVQSINPTPNPDLAVLSGQGPSAAPAVLASDNPPAGTQVWAAGYPEGDQLSLLPGAVMDYVDGSAYGLSGQLMEITNPIKPGSSGSPLLDSAGKVVGVVFALTTATGEGLAVPVSDLSSYLAAPDANASGACIG